jgi:hypothetical protein
MQPITIITNIEAKIMRITGNNSIYSEFILYVKFEILIVLSASWTFVLYGGEYGILEGGSSTHALVTHSLSVAS